MSKTAEVASEDEPITPPQLPGKAEDSPKQVIVALKDETSRTQHYTPDEADIEHAQRVVTQARNVLIRRKESLTKSLMEVDIESVYLNLQELASRGVEEAPEDLRDKIGRFAKLLRQRAEISNMTCERCLTITSAGSLSPTAYGFQQDRPSAAHSIKTIENAITYSARNYTNVNGLNSMFPDPSYDTNSVDWLLQAAAILCNIISGCNVQEVEDSDEETDEDGSMSGSDARS